MTVETSPPAPSGASDPSEKEESAATTARDDERPPESDKAPLVTTVIHPRGLIAPLLSGDNPLWRRFVRAVWRLVQGLYLHDAFDAAPSMAFHFFLSLPPLLVFLGYVVALVAQRTGVEAVLWPLLEQLPPESAAVVHREVDRLAGASTLAPIAAAGFLWVAAGGTHGLMNALEVAVGAPRRRWWKKRLLAFGWVIGSLVTLTALSFGVVEWDSFIHPPEIALTVEDGPSPPPTSAPSSRLAADDTVPQPKEAPVASSEVEPRKTKVIRRHALRIFRGNTERVLALGLFLAFSVLALAAFFRFSIAHPTNVKRHTLPGAVLAVAIWLVISWGFGLYVRTLASYAIYYGSLAAVVVLLMWLWLTSLAILVGAELNAQLEGLRD